MEIARLVIDRFEGEMAVCEKADRTLVNIPRRQLPPGAQEGDVLIVEGDNLRVDPVETARRQRAAAAKLKKLTGKS